MKSKKITAAFISAAAAALMLACSKPAPEPQAAAPSTARVNTIIADWERAKNFTKAYIDSSDEKSYAFKASSKVRSFADQLLHIAEANYGFAQAATGKKAELGFGMLEGKDTYKTKADVSKAVLDSYDFVISAVKEMNDTQLADTCSIALGPNFKPVMSKEQMLSKGFEHQTHHRGQATQYLRAQGKTPPEEMLF